MKVPGRLRRLTTVLVFVCFIPIASTACEGKFQLVHKVYRLNAELGPDKGVRWLDFIALNVVPIYALALFIDLAFANSVEFWTRSNPVDADTAEFSRLPLAARPCARIPGPGADSGCEGVSGPTAA